VIGRREQALNYAVLGVFSLIALYPIVGILLTALAPEGELASFGAPSGIALGNFADAWDQGHFATYLRSSAIVAVSVVVASTLLSILSGYAFGLMRFRGSTALFYVFLIGLMVPAEALVGDEDAGLMQLLRDYLRDERAEILDNAIRLSAVPQPHWPGATFSGSFGLASTSSLR